MPELLLDIASEVPGDGVGLTPVADHVVEEGEVADQLRAVQGREVADQGGAAAQIVLGVETLDEGDVVGHGGLGGGIEGHHHL